MAKKSNARKTVEVEFLLETVNHFLKTSEDDKKAERQGMINLLDTVLHKTGNYQGFRYLPQWEVPGAYPGIWLDPETGLHDPATCFENTDPTRAKFH